MSPGVLKLFTASFTLNGDQLSQWRGYSRGSAGVSLGFDLRTIRYFSAPVGEAIFAPCVYRDEDKERLLRYAMASYVESMLELTKEAADIPTLQRNLEDLRKLQPELDSESAQDVYFRKTELKRKKRWNEIQLQTGMQLLYLIALLKHSAFEEEQEWRIVLPYFTNVRKPTWLQFRSRSNTLVPFVEFTLIGKVDGVPSFRLKEVILGPGSEGETAADASRAFLASVDDQNSVIVRESRIPYRPW
jgi:hypothetical protein